MVVQCIAELAGPFLSQNDLFALHILRKGRQLLQLTLSICAQSNITISLSHNIQ